MSSENPTHVLLICTVGGAPEPICATLKRWQPARTLFVHSPDTRANAQAVADLVALPVGAWDALETVDPQDFGGCVRDLRRLDAQVAAWNGRSNAHATVVDLTGGTKAMSAALALAARRWPCTFSYVGGDQRTKDGVGIVVSGKEKIVHGQNPWDALGYQALEDACLRFDELAFTSAAVGLARAKRACTDPAVSRTLATIALCCEAYAAWDRFQHLAAASRLNAVTKNANDLTVALGAARADSVLRQIQAGKAHLAQLAQARVSRATVLDLLANAQRRRTEGRHDDAVARLYRAIEATAQLALGQRGFPGTDRIALTAVPAELQREWQTRAQEGILRLGLQDAFRLLGALGDPVGARFVTLGLADRERSPLTARNQSILAHGFEPVTEKTSSTLWQAALELAAVSEAELPRFPRLAG